MFEFVGLSGTWVSWSMTVVNTHVDMCIHLYSHTPYIRIRIHHTHLYSRTPYTHVFAAYPEGKPANATYLYLEVWPPRPDLDGTEVHILLSCLGKVNVERRWVLECESDTRPVCILDQRTVCILDQRRTLVHLSTSLVEERHARLTLNASSSTHSAPPRHQRAYRTSVR